MKEPSEQNFEEDFRAMMHEEFQRMDAMEAADRRHDAGRLCHAVLVLIDLAGFRLSGRLHLVDKQTGAHFK